VKKIVTTSARSASALNRVEIAAAAAAAAAAVI